LYNDPEEFDCACIGGCIGIGSIAIAPKNKLVYMKEFRRIQLINAVETGWFGLTGTKCFGDELIRKYYVIT
jgi:hypothetical protein